MPRTVAAREHFALANSRFYVSAEAIARSAGARELRRESLE